MNKKLAPDWWNQGLNLVTGFKAGSQERKGYRKTSDEVKYFNVYSTLEIKINK